MTDFDLAALPARATWVLAGDSITHGVFHTHGERSWAELLHERVRWELDRLDDVVINAGVSGWTAAQVLAEYDWLIGRFGPDVLNVSLGTNDAAAGKDGLEAFAADLTRIAERAKAGGAQLVLHTPVLTLADAPAWRREHLGAYAQTVREVANRVGATLVDHEEAWERELQGAAPTAWMDDHTHPNAVGHRRMANLTLATLGLGELDERP